MSTKNDRQLRHAQRIGRARCSARLGAAIGSMVVVTLTSANAVAWQLSVRDCWFGSNHMYWASGHEQVFRCTNFAFPGFPSSPLPAGDKDVTSAQSAMAWAHWMWYRWGGTSTQYWLDQTTPHQCANKWWEGLDGTSEEWYSLLGAPGGPAPGAITQLNAETCWWGGGRSKILAADIVVNASVPWQIVLQNSLERCLEPTDLNLETVALHEIGHAYGLDHESSAFAIMNPQALKGKNCAVGSGFHGYPMPDDYQGYLHYHQVYLGNRYNVAGTPWYRGPTGLGSLDKKQLRVTPSSPARVTMTVTMHSFYNHPGPTVNVWYYAIPVGTIPTFVPSAGIWTSLGTKLNRSYSIAVPGWFSHGLRQDFDVTYGELPHAGTFRIWVFVDASYQLPEVEEGDNVFPTGIVIER